MLKYKQLSTTALEVGKQLQVDLSGKENKKYSMKRYTCLARIVKFVKSDTLAESNLVIIELQFKELWMHNQKDRLKLDNFNYIFLI